MSYHQWLSCAPKHHLTSSAQNGFSNSKSNSARPVQGQFPAIMANHAAAPMPSPTLPRAKNHQATPFTPRSALSSTEKACSDRLEQSPLPYQPITPPSHPDDSLPYGGYANGLEPIHGLGRTQAELYDMKPPSNPHCQTRGIRSPIGSVSSRDISSGMLAEKGSKVGKSRPALPSPPSSPQAPLKSLPGLIDSKRSITTSSRRRSADHQGASHWDPMLQTSSDPHFWSSNCTVLKADTHLKVGSVISPTCMVGLPFGSMTEMAVPDPDVTNASCTSLD